MGRDANRETGEHRARGGVGGECVSEELSKDLLHHFPVDIRQAEVAAGVAVGQFLVVEAQQPQDGGVQVVHVDLVLDRVVAELVGRAVL